jgi:hypothetical protein
MVLVPGRGSVEKHCLKVGVPPKWDGCKATTQLQPSFPSLLAKEVGGWVERKLNLACLE